MSRLEEQLKQYAESGIYPMHMPGHKRNLPPAQDLPYRWDVTEVPGTDDLHCAEGILADAMKRTAELYGAARTFYLVGGSTCGILAGIRAMVLQGERRRRESAGTALHRHTDPPAHRHTDPPSQQHTDLPSLIIARNCHRSVFHAVELTGARVCWIEPEEDARFGISRGITAEQVKEAIRICPEALGVVLTSPTYEGILSDVAAIAEACHASGIPLMVDEAHGAHLGLFEREFFPDGALRCGADIVVQSAHKTLPSLTQTAWLHLGGMEWMRPDRTEWLRSDRTEWMEEISRQLDVFETSSPSYPLMVSLDGCTQLLLARGEEIFRQWKESLLQFYEMTGALKCLEVMSAGPVLRDPSKILISGRRAGLTGARLAQILREEYGFETEMSCGYNILAMTGAGDDPAAVHRFAQAILEIDGKCFSGGTGTEAGVKSFSGTAGEETGGKCFSETADTEELGCRNDGDNRKEQSGYRHLQPYFGETTILSAVLRPAEEVTETEAEGRICAEYVFCYPPGVPVLIPGERITREKLDRMDSLRECGTEIRRSAGSRDSALRCVIPEPAKP